MLYNRDRLQQQVSKTHDHEEESKRLANPEVPIIRPLIWLGSSKKKIQSFPEEVKKLIGDELQIIQFGGMPKDAKPFKGVGSGVFEIAIKYDNDAYRCVQAVQLGKYIYVLHAFQKKSKKGIETPKPDVDLIKKRYQEAVELANNE
ncbi:MAG: type II toxin-antitoxin system RelE/ParE family toxin [Symploca sp. SIO3E6]|nr:type II toxin-antitoxin system RelE/ParE family toxin [Caldora sp. SIO3E6]